MAGWKWKNTQLDHFDAKKIWKNATSYTVLALAVGAMTFFGVCDPSTTNNQLPSGDAAQVGSAKITGMEFRRAYRNTYARYQQQFKDQFDPKALDLSGRVLDQLVNEFILYTEALESGIFATNNEITKLILEQEAFKNEQGKFDTEKFTNYLRAVGHSEESFENEIKRSLTSDKFRRLINDTYRISNGAAQLEYKLKETKLDVEYLKMDKSKIKTTITDADIQTFLGDEKNKTKVKEYYTANKSEFDSPKKVKALHILSSFKGARNASGAAKDRPEAEAQKRAEDILAKVNGGANFANLAKEMTDDPAGKENGGDLGFFEFDAMVKPFSDAAFKMKAGEVSGPVKSAFGFHVIKVVDIQPEKKTPYEQAEKSIAKKELKKDKAPKILDATSTKLLADLNNKKDISSQLGKLGIEWQSTGVFASNARFIPTLGSDKEIKGAVLQLKQPGETYKSVVDVKGTKYIFRLKSKTAADESKLDKNTLKDITDSKKLFEAYTVFNDISKMFQEKYKNDNLISLNEEYKNFDANREEPR